MKGLPQWERGTTSRQAHVGLPPGTVEEEHGRAGFYGSASHLYRLHPPTSWTAVEGPAAHRLLDTARFEARARLWPTVLLGNADVRIGLHHADTALAELCRNADGDEIRFVHQGEGVLRTEYGPLSYGPGDYVVVPRGTTTHLEPSTSTLMLVIETSGEAALPDRGLLGRHALFDPAIVEVPEPGVVDVDGEFVVAVKRGGETTRVTYPFHPFDVVGWKGDVAPMRLATDDIRPIVSPRYHLPPSAHSTFVADGVVVATFVPRPMEEDPDALRLPFFHRNVDYDEVIFYHSGSFFSRADIAPGAMSFHPAGLHHGPQPSAVTRDAAAEGGPGRRVDETAVMVDARHPLRITPAGADLDVPGYVDSWKES